MTSVGTLWGHALQRQTKVILSVAAVNGLKLEQPEWSYPDKPPQFLVKFPHGKIPVFEGTDGFKLIEGATIARYLSSIGTEANLLGSNAHEVAIVDQWAHFAESELGTPTYYITGMIYGYYPPFNLESINKVSEYLDENLTYLESHLATRESGYVALDTLTLADFVLAGAIFNASRLCLGAAERAKYPHVFAHYAKVTGDERVKQYWGTEQFTDVRVTEPRELSIS